MAGPGTEGVCVAAGEVSGGAWGSWGGEEDLNGQITKGTALYRLLAAARRSA